MYFRKNINWFYYNCAEDDDLDAGGNSSSSEADEEWVPSCWDSMAQPARSSLKSPDKTSSVSSHIKSHFMFYEIHIKLLLFETANTYQEEDSSVSLVFH